MNKRGRILRDPLGLLWDRVQRITLKKIKISLLLNLIPMEIVVTQRIEVSHAKHEHYEIEKCP